MTQTSMISQTIFQQASIGLALVGREGQFLGANPYYCKLVGYMEEELKERTFQSITHPDDLDSDIQQAERLYRGEISSYELEKRYIQKNKGIIWVKLTCSLLHESDTTVGLAVVQDISRQKQTEQAYQESQQQLTAALNASKTGIFRWNIQENTMRWDDNLSSVFGRPDGTAVQWFYDFIALVHPDDQASVLSRCHASEQSATDFEMEYRTIWPDNSIHWIYSKGTTFLDQENCPSYMVGACVDITERKQAELALKRSEEHFRFVTNAAPVMLWLTDENNNTTFINRTWLEFTGQTADEILGYGWLDKVHPDDREPVCKEFIQFCNCRGPLELEYRLQRKDGVYRHMLDAGAPLVNENGEFIGYIGYVLDITRRKEIEQALAKVSQKLSQSNYDLEQFASIASHDLQAPLRKIETFSATIHENVKDTADEETLDLLDRMNHSVNTMQTLVRDLLSLSRISQEHSVFVPVDLNNVFTQALSNLSNEIERTGAIIEAVPLCVVLGDVSQLTQLFQNLLENALKYQPEGQRPVVTIQSVFMGDDCQIIFQDNGIGFKQENVKRIFQPFIRLHGKTGPYKGTGIGLAICQRIVERHRGAIDAHSEPGHGASFMVTLPVYRENDTHQPEQDDTLLNVTDQ